MNIQLFRYSYYLKSFPIMGFFLNGKRTPFKAYAIIHDLGPLGGAVNDASYPSSDSYFERLWVVIAIRTSH